MLTNKKDIDAWCKAMHISEYVIYDDLSIKAFQDVDISSQKLNYIPVKFLETLGNFNCYNNNLTTLKNVPDTVGEIFNCSVNKLTSLEHSPKVAKSDFKCSFNQIKSLEHITPSIGGDLNISNNPIEKLDYCPSIGYSLLCHNCNLTGFEGFPQKIVGSLNCYNNKISSFDNCPTDIGLHFYFDNNPTFSFKKAPQKIGGNFIFGFTTKNTQILNAQITDFDLSNIQIGEELTHFTDKKENFISGLEIFYVWKNNGAILKIEQEQINAFKLNNKLNIALSEPVQTNHNKKHKI